MPSSAANLAQILDKFDPTTTTTFIEEENAILSICVDFFDPSSAHSSKHAS